MEVRRGDLVTVALQGDYGKPRPALVIQADQFADLGSVVILPITAVALARSALMVLYSSPSARACSAILRAAAILASAPL